MSRRRPQTESELVDLVRSIDAAAPDELHRRVEELVAERSGRRRRAALPTRSARNAGLARWRLGGAVGLAVALAVAFVVGLPGGGSALTLRAASALTLRPATEAAPGESPRNRAQLAAAVDGIPFPYWHDRFGWRSTGARSDRISGRTVTTVFYANDRGQRIGYAIVAGAPAPHASGGTLTWRGGTAYRMLTVNGSQVVTWLRDGRMCVISGRGVSSATLLVLASWDDRGTAA